MASSTFDFSIITGNTIKKILTTSRLEIIGVVHNAYLSHHKNLTVNPDSYFLRFPNKPESRIRAARSNPRGTTIFRHQMDRQLPAKCSKGHPQSLGRADFKQL